MVKPEPPFGYPNKDKKSRVWPDKKEKEATAKEATKEEEEEDKEEEGTEEEEEEEELLDLTAAWLSQSQKQLSETQDVLKTLKTRAQERQKRQADEEEAAKEKVVEILQEVSSLQQAAIESIEAATDELLQTPLKKKPKKK